MPPASSATRPSRPLPATALGAAAMRVRWDRVGRVALLLLLAAVVLLYVRPASSLLSTWHQSHATQARLDALQREHETLARQARGLSSPRAVEQEARRLGLVRPGERSYVIADLPRD
jgi:cell division protein FtsB